MAMPEYLYSPLFGTFHVRGEFMNDYLVEPLDPQGFDSHIDRVHKGLVGTPPWQLEKPVAQRKQIGGNHYSKHTIQPWDIIDEYKLDYYLGNVVKYVLRDKNNKLEDLEKALHFLEKRIELEKSRVQA